LCVSEQTARHTAAIAGCGVLARRFQLIADRVSARTDLSDGRAQRADNSTEQPSVQATPLAGSRILSQTPRPRDDDVIALPGATGAEHSPGLRLDQVVHWLLQQRQGNGTLIWLSGLEQCGPEFDEVMPLLSQTAVQAAVYVDDPMLRNGLPSGRYDYRVPGNDAASHTRVSLGRKDCLQLHTDLRQLHRQLQLRFDTLMIPLLSGDSDELMLALRQQGYLA
jgi:hypothetical protein